MIMECWGFPHSTVYNLEIQKVSGIVQRLETHGTDSNLNLKFWKLGALRAGENGCPSSVSQAESKFNHLPLFCSI